MPASVLVTGAAGRMAAVLRDCLAETVPRVRLMSREPLSARHPNEEIVHGDLSNLDAVSEAVAGMQAVLHLGAIADEAPFPDILASNVVGTYHVYEAARRAGADRVVYASSHHIIGCYPRSHRLGVEDPVRPDTHYGVSKAYGEALARLYYDKWGLQSVCLRIGSMRERPENERQLSTWLSYRDGRELVRRSLCTPRVGCLVLFGVSANTRSWWDNGGAAAVIGYAPVDNAERYAAELTGSNVDVAGPQGGHYADPGYEGGLW